MINGTVEPFVGSLVARLSASVNSSGILAAVEPSVTGVRSEVSNGTPKTSSFPTGSSSSSPPSRSPGSPASSSDPIFSSSSVGVLGTLPGSWVLVSTMRPNSSSASVEGKKLGRVTLLVPWSPTPKSSTFVVNALIISVFMVDSSTASDPVPDLVIVVVVNCTFSGNVVVIVVCAGGAVVVGAKLNKFGRNIPENPVDIVLPVVMSVARLPSAFVVFVVVVVEVVEVKVVVVVDVLVVVDSRLIPKFSSKSVSDTMTISVVVPELSEENPNSSSSITESF